MSAQVPGIPLARSWGDIPPPYARVFFELTDEELAEQFSGTMNCEHNYLAISGGGDNGAFGAGVLVGWTAAGDRPEFTMVTGISTGALIAPFAFLGPEYDEQRKKTCTTYNNEDMLKTRRKLTVITGDTMFDTEPLKDMIARRFTREMMGAIAAGF